MGDIIYIDVEDGKKRVLNNAALYRKLLTKFRTETALEPMFEAIEAGSYEEARGIAHTLKGVTANLSLKEFNLQIQELEAQVKAEKIVPETIASVKAAFAETIVHIDKVLAENAG